MRSAASKYSTQVSWRRILRLLWLLPLLLVSTLFIGAFMLFLRADFVLFRPHLSEVVKRVDTQRAATPQMPDFFVRCLEKDPWSDIDYFTARQLLPEHGLESMSSRSRMFRALLHSASLK